MSHPNKYLKIVLDLGYCSCYCDTLSIFVFGVSKKPISQFMRKTIYSFITQLGIALNHRNLHKSRVCPLPEWILRSIVLWWGYQNWTLLTQFGTVLKAHFKSRAVYRISRILDCHLIVWQLPPLVLSCISPFLTGVYLKSTPQQRFCLQSSTSRSVSGNLCNTVMHRVVSGSWL